MLSPPKRIQDIQKERKSQMSPSFILKGRLWFLWQFFLVINIIDRENADDSPWYYVIFLFYINFNSVRARNMMKKRRSTAKFAANRARDNARPLVPGDWFLSSERKRVITMITPGGASIIPSRSDKSGPKQKINNVPCEGLARRRFITSHKKYKRWTFCLLLDMINLDNSSVKFTYRSRYDCSQWLFLWRFFFQLLLFIGIVRE